MECYILSDILPVVRINDTKSVGNLLNAYFPIFLLEVFGERKDFRPNAEGLKFDGEFLLFGTVKHRGNLFGFLIFIASWTNIKRRMYRQHRIIAFRFLLCVLSLNNVSVFAEKSHGPP